MNTFYYLVVILFLLDDLTSFDIKNQVFKFLIYVGLLIGTPTMLFWNLAINKTKRQRILGTIFPIIFLILIFALNPLTILFSLNAWQTQTVLYQHKHLSFKRVELQMQNMGALGYNRRTVEVFYLTPLFIITSKVSDDIDKRVEWVKTNKNVNELEIIYP